jgi:hypothetical protein
MVSVRVHFSPGFLLGAANLLLQGSWNSGEGLFGVPFPRKMKWGWSSVVLISAGNHLKMGKKHVPQKSYPKEQISMKLLSWKICEKNVLRKILLVGEVQV